MLLKQLLRLHPHARILSILELQQGRQQRGTKHLGALTRKQRGQVVDADYVERQVGVAEGRYVGDGDGGFVECGGDVVDWDGVVGVCSIRR